MCTFYNEGLEANDLIHRIPVAPVLVQEVLENAFHLATAGSDPNIYLPSQLPETAIS